MSNLSIKTVFAKLFSLVFFVLSASIMFVLVSKLITGLINGDDIMQLFLSSINTGVIALAVFELAMAVHHEYGKANDGQDDIVTSLRQTLPRFVGTVCVALSLEGLIMVIKYSQLEMAGNLYYPVAIIASTSLLLAALGLFLKLTDKSERPAPQVLSINTSDDQPDA